MRPLSELSDAWARRLEEQLDALDVPGAVLGVSHRGERVVVAAGVCGLRNPAPVTAATAFQLGSISKLYTATLLLSITGPEILEVPVSELVPEAWWMEPELHVGHLLTHSSGLGGDVFADTGRGEDCLARYVADLAALERDVPGAPGRRYSYCNSGFGVLGRLVEVLTGSGFDVALRERLLDPLGVRATTTLPEQTILGPVALGHNRSDDRALTADDVWNLPRSSGPLGGLCATADDVLTFAQMHLADGRAPNGTRILAADTARLMRARHLQAPPYARPSARGLGFGIYDWPAAELVGHDGETTGQIARLRLLCDHDLALVVLTNAIPDGEPLSRALEEAVLSELDLTPPELPAAVPDPALDPRPYEGRYRNRMGTAVVSGAPGGLRLDMYFQTEGLPEETDSTRLAPIGDDAFVDADLARPTRAVRFADPGPDGRFCSYDYGRIAWREEP